MPLFDPKMCQLGPFSAEIDSLTYLCYNPGHNHVKTAMKNWKKIGLLLGFRGGGHSSEFMEKLCLQVLFMIHYHNCLVLNSILVDCNICK